MAKTVPTMLSEHAANPFVAGLGPPLDFEGHFRMLRRTPEHSDSERSLPPHLRRYCAMRVLDYIDPLDCQIELSERIGMAMRQGYKWRDPSKGLHRPAILESVERLERRDMSYMLSRELDCSASGFALLGHPGMGKTLTVNLVLNSYPRVLTPKLPYLVKQIPCLRVDCPAKGSFKQFCVYVLKAIDDRAGTNYFKTLASDRRMTSDLLILYVQNVLQLHAVGLLVVDELQHLNESNEGPKPLMNAIVTLINIVGIPVLLVGTMGSARIIQEDFREARRASGFGSPVWTRLPRGAEWDGFLSGLWRYQWTAEPSPLTPEIGAALHDATQGIIDLAVRLFMLVQFRVIARGEVRGGNEIIDAGIVSRVARDEFGLVRPMIESLRAGNENDLDRFPDLKTLQQHVDHTMALNVGVPLGEIRAKEMERQRSPVHDARDPMAAVRAGLEKRGVEASVVEAILAKVGETHPGGDLFELTQAAVEALASRTPGRRKLSCGTKAAAQDDPSDLRCAVRIAKETGRTCHEVLAKSGVVASAAAILAS